MDTLDLLYLTSLGISGVGITYLIKERGALRENLQNQSKKIESLKSDLASGEAHTSTLEKVHQEKIAGLQQMISDRDNTIESITKDKNQQIEILKSERSSVLDDIKEFLGTDFKNTSNEAFDKANKKLFSQFDQFFNNKNKLAKKDIQGLVNPINETLDELKKANKDFASTFERDFSSIHSLVGLANQNMEKNMLETAKLTTALKGSTNTTGRWGEEQLKRILEVSQMSEHVDYVEQDSLEDNSRPDAIIYLPGNRQVVIDSKASVNDFISSCETEDPATQKILLQKHARNIRAHMLSLSKKKYWDSLDSSVDTVIMFVPGDNFLQAALKEDPKIFIDAMKHKVIVTGPQTLLLTLKVYSFMWSKDKQTREAGKIIDIGKELLRRVKNMTTHIATLGENLRKAGNSYNSFIGSMDAKFIPKANELADFFPELEEKKAKKPALIENAIKESTKIVSIKNQGGNDRE